MQSKNIVIKYYNSFSTKIKMYLFDKRNPRYPLQVAQYAFVKITIVDFFDKYSENVRKNSVDLLYLYNRSIFCVGKIKMDMSDFLHFIIIRGRLLLLWYHRPICMDKTSITKDKRWTTRMSISTIGAYKPNQIFM